MSHTRNQWTELNLKREAKKYKTRKEFQVNSPGAYDSAFDLNLLNDICPHMKTPEFTAIVRYLYVFEFEDHCAYIGISYNPEERRDAHIKGKRKGHKMDSFVHRKIKSGVPYTFIVFPQSLKPEEVAILEESKIQEYRNNGWTLLNQAKGGSLGGKPITWTRNKIFREAKKYQFRRDFREKAPGAYDRAIDLGILQEVYAHMPKRAPNKVRSKIEN